MVDVEQVHGDQAARTLLQSTACSHCVDHEPGGGGQFYPCHVDRFLDNVICGAAVVIWGKIVSFLCCCAVFHVVELVAELDKRPIRGTVQAYHRKTVPAIQALISVSGLPWHLAF